MLRHHQMRLLQLLLLRLLLREAVPLPLLLWLLMLLLLLLWLFRLRLLLLPLCVPLLLSLLPVVSVFLLPPWRLRSVHCCFASATVCAISDKQALA
jgi:hypothetical protein